MRMRMFSNSPSLHKTTHTYNTREDNITHQHKTTQRNGRTVCLSGRPQDKTGQNRVRMNNTKTTIVLLPTSALLLLLLLLLPPLNFAPASPRLALPVGVTVTT